MSKKLIRKGFRDSVFKRDRYRCKVCGVIGVDRQGGDNHIKFHNGINAVELDAHHIVNRTEFLNGGYVAANGISLCPDCHIKAEVFHSTGTALPGFAPEELYLLINSNLDAAVEMDKKLNNF